MSIMTGSIHLRFSNFMFQYRKGDYHRYLAEFASGDKRKGAATAAHDAYKVSYFPPAHNT
jgi:14-3-3 protein